MANSSDDEDRSLASINDEQAGYEDVQSTPLETLEQADRDVGSGRITRQVMTMMGAVGRSNPFVDKMGPEHITKVLDEMSVQGEREYNAFTLQAEHAREDTTAARRYTFAYFVLAAAVLFGIIWVFKDDSEMLKTILVPVITAVGGWGLGRAQK